jgi:hypothetical protein
MANQYYNTGANHAEYSPMPQSGPFQQQNSASTTATQQQQQQQQQHLYHHSPYTVHPLSQHAHAGYATSDSHGVLAYTPTMHPSRWVCNHQKVAKTNLCVQDDTDPDYEMDQQTHDHQQQHLQAMQAPAAPQESQSHANLQSHPPLTAGSNPPEQMSPATRPGVVRTGTSSIFHDWMAAKSDR